jgi:hypothetical protein
MNTRGIVNITTLIVFVAIAGCASQSPSWVAPVPATVADAPSMDPPAGPPAPTNPDPWPQKFSFAGSSGNVTLMVYQPQVERWEGNRVNFRAAVSVKTDGSTAETFGVIWATARTEVNRVARMVTLEDLKLTRSNFPTLADNGASYLQQQLLFTGTSRAIALDRLEASLAASGTVHPTGVAVKNEPPQIIVTYSPAILVPISGKPVWRDVPDSRFERVINTRALILRKKWEKTCFLHVYDGWLSAASIEGRWSQASNLPWHIEEVANKLVEKKLVDPLSGGNAQPPPLANGIPAIYVSQKPAEIIVFKGQPNLEPISQTTLLWASNTTADVIVDTSTNFYYVLISGRWFRASSLNSPWRFVVGTNLPPDFSRIPVSSPAGVAQASVPGTPQAREAVIANLIPQTAAIPRAGGPTFKPVFDGTPQFKPIQGTPLQRVVNSPTPIIRVDGYPCCGSASANVYGHYGSTSWSGTNTWYSHSSGNIGESASGSYTNYRIGTTGSYSANRCVNPYDGDAARGYRRTYDTAGGTTGSVSRGKSYDAQSGQTSYGADKTATGVGGSSVTRDTRASWGAQGASADRSTTTYNAQTGQTKTYGSGSDGGDRYASANGENYRNDGSGWQKQTSNGWQSAGGENTSWADREQQARSQAQSRFSSFGQSGGWGSHFGGGRFDGGGFRR